MPPKNYIQQLLSKLQPVLNEGDFVFASVDHDYAFDLDMVHGFFREKEGITLIMKKEVADSINLKYDYMASCITLDMYPEIDADIVGLHAAITSILANKGISFNIVAGYYHDHVFVDKKDVARTIEVLQDLTNDTI